uniref:uncharacterized protein LOC124065273 isoform X2 n=1 Tax=Scatophagus argus TaxID=75038 RepID=UPI001ED805F9|nr:uncharacterized protein LOC124065273 isoform X2 [Scatophagus argus]
MSLTVVKDKGVALITVPSDSKSLLPPLCQILQSPCYSPMCCSVRKGLMQSNLVSALGAVQIMVGLFNIGLGPGRTSRHPEDFADLEVAYWLGGLYIAVGIVSVFADQFPSRCLVGFAALMNIVGSIFSVVGIVLYAIDLGDDPVSTGCFQDRYNAHRYNDEDCIYVAHIAQRLLTAMDITMIVLAALQLCVCISFAVLAIRALVNREKDEGDRDVEIYKPLLADVLVTSPHA